MLKVEAHRRICIPIHHISVEEFYPKVVRWCFGFTECLIFESSAYRDKRFYQYDWLVLADAVRVFSSEYVLQRQTTDFQDWVGMVLAYDFKHTVLSHTNLSKSFFYQPEAYFFNPRWVFYAKNGQIFAEVTHEDVFRLEDVVKHIQNTSLSTHSDASLPHYDAHTSKEEYVATFDKIQHHLYQGDIYEMNYCVFYSSDDVIVDLPDAWLQISARKKAPMGGFFKVGNTAVLCQSPERFFTIIDKKIYSQPIKGTSKRGADLADDEILRKKLFESTKERAENVMIVDLVRNDISRICEPGSIAVEELFGIHTFASVHQMISTVSGTLQADITIGQMLKALFPMGSMTGAPKLSAMNIIRSVETHDRGIYSGTAGYISPAGDLDCNVIIRSIVADLMSGKSYIGVGSAVTVYANAEDEYEECLLKLSSVIR